MFGDDKPSLRDIDFLVTREDTIRWRRETASRNRWLATLGRYGPSKIMEKPMHEDVVDRTGYELELEFLEETNAWDEQIYREYSEMSHGEQNE